MLSSSLITKWVEVFAVSDQKAETIAKLLVEGVISRHGAPQELLSDCGANFLSALVLEVCKLFDIKKVNTSGYNPQTSGLCERFNSTLIQMLYKTVERYSQDWDRHLSYCPCFMLTEFQSRNPPKNHLFFCFMVETLRCLC